MHVAFGPEPIIEGGRRCSHSTNLLGFLFLCGFVVVVFVVFAPFLIISTHFSVSLYSRHPLDHFPQVTSSSVFSLDIYYSSLCPQHLLTLSLSRWPVICLLSHQGLLPSPHLILTAVCHMGPCLTWDNFLPWLPGDPMFIFPTCLAAPPPCPKLQMVPQTLVLEIVLTAPSHIFKCHDSLKVLVAQSCLTLNPMDCSLPGYPVLGILQARILEWIAIPVSRGLSDLNIKPTSPALAGEFVTTDPPGTSSLCSPSKFRITRRQGAAPTRAWRAQYELQLPGNNGSALSATHYLGGFKGMIIFSFLLSLIFKEHTPPTRQTHYVFLKNEEPKITWSDQTKKIRISRTLFFFLWKWKWKWSCSIVSDSLRPHGL